MVKDGAMDLFILWAARRRERERTGKTEGKGSSCELPYNTFAYIPGARTKSYFHVYITENIEFFFMFWLAENL